MKPSEALTTKHSAAIQQSVDFTCDLDCFAAPAMAISASLLSFQQPASPL
jgi:hypothetical protein